MGEREYNSYGAPQLNIENFNPLPTGEELFQKGLQLLNQRNYKQAVSILSDAIKTDPSISDAYYYLAIALLSGRKPKKVDVWTIQEIEENLNAAIHGNNNPSKCYALWAIVKHGYYKMNSFLENAPTSAQLFSLGESIKAEQAREILAHLNDPSNPYWMQLYNKFGKA